MKTEDNKLFIFRNNIYDLSNITEWHPAGFQLLNGVRNGEVEKYLLGIYSSTKLQYIKSHAHSKDSIKLLEPPIARLNIPSCFKGLHRDNCVSVSELRLVSKASNIYELHLKTKNSGLDFAGYTDIKQIGRFYWLTLNNKITRLYTCANFLTGKNVILLKAALKQSDLL